MSDKTLIATAIVVAFLAGLGVTFLFLHTSAKKQADVISPVVVSRPTTTETKATGTASANPTTNTQPTKTTQSPQSAPQPSPTPTKTTQPTKQTASPYDATVIYNGNQFIPDRVTIPVGGTVRWVNVSDSEKMWVASNAYPNDDIYPEKSENDCFGSSFNQCTAVGQGGSWTFTFTRVGGWGYHNDVQASDNATVNVVTKDDYINHHY